MSLELNNAQVDAIRRNDTTRNEVRSSLAHPELLDKSMESLDEGEFAELYDAAENTLINEGPVVVEFLAEQDKGEYHVQICGVEGAYYVRAPEYDHYGAFSTLVEAEGAVYSDFGEFLVNEDDEESEEDAPECPFCGAVGDDCPHLVADYGTGEEEFGGGEIYGIQQQLLSEIEARIEEDGTESDEYPIQVLINFLNEDRRVQSASFLVDEATGTYEYTSYWAANPEEVLSDIKIAVAS